MRISAFAYCAAARIFPLLARPLSFITSEIEYEKCVRELSCAYSPVSIAFKELPKLRSQIDLSFVVPVYNSQKYLERCVDSLVNQKTSYNYEVILVDDGSEDNSGKIADQYEDKFEFVRVLHQDNAGISAARNRGISSARGRYLAFVDNDDCVDESYVQILMDRAYETDADVVKCGHYRWNVESNSIISKVKYDDASYQDDIGRNILKLKGFIWEGVSKRELWEEFRFPEGYWYEDIITRFVILRSASKIETVGDVLYYYSIHDSNASKSVWKHSEPKCLDEIYLIEAVLKLEISKNERALSHALLYELCGVLWSRTRNQPLRLRICVFNVASEIIKNHIIQDEEYDEFEKQLIAIFYNRSFVSWELLSCAKMLNVKLANDYGIAL